MPELPEVETIRRALAPALQDAHVQRVRLERRDIVTGRATPKDLLAGARISETLRHGKQLAITGHPPESPCLSVHLGMSGRLTLFPGRSREADRPTHTHAVWTLDSPAQGLCELWFTDPRRFGGIWTHESARDLREQRWSRLGPDALTVRAPRLARALSGRQSPVKAVLLDQRAVAGIGNIYADEALFHARLHPRRLAASLEADDVRRLAGSIRRVLRAAIGRGGTTIRDYRTPSGGVGGYLDGAAVYGRAGRPCRRCGQLLHNGLVTGRTTVWCPTCQPPPPSASLSRSRVERRS